MYGRMKTVPRFESELRPTDERLMSTTIIMGDAAAAAAQSSAQLGFVSFGIVACRALHQTMANAAAAADSTRGGAGRDAGAASESVRQSKLSSIVLVAPNEGPPIGGAATTRDPTRLLSQLHSLRNSVCRPPVAFRMQSLFCPPHFHFFLISKSGSGWPRHFMLFPI